MCQYFYHFCSFFVAVFTGIIECLATVHRKEQQGNNVQFWISSPIADALKVDQSVSHDGVCLTVTGFEQGCYTVVAINETLQRTTLGGWTDGTLLNTERCMPANGRFDGHIVQGHVDCTAVLQTIEDELGSWVLTFTYPEANGITVEKGSICVNGISLTVVHSSPGKFSVAIIPYTWEHTNLSALKSGAIVNIEFDIVGKYIQKMMLQQHPL